MYWKYLKYILRHKYYVFIECIKLGLIWRGIVHDLSKLLPSEFIPYARFFYGNYPTWSDMLPGIKSVYFGPTVETVSKDFDKAWLLHQHRNKHHHQFWVLKEDDGGVKVIPIPSKYCKEMVADWRGASIAIKGFDDTLNWYKGNKDRMILHESTRNLVELLLMWGNA